MVTRSEARDSMCDLVNTGWLASPVTSSLPMLWDDVQGDKPGHDSNGLPIAYGRTTVTHTVTTAETIGGVGIGKDLNEGIITVQVFTPKGDGREAADEIAQVVKGFFQRKSFTGGWFSSPSAIEVPSDGPWNQTNVSAPFTYEERIDG